MGDVSVRTAVFSSIIAFGLAVTLVPSLRASSPGDDDVLTQVLGGTRQIAAKAACEEADLYFHGGVSGGCPHDDDGCHDEATERTSTASNLPLGSLIKRIQGDTAPKDHVHLNAAHQKELLPWFVAAAHLNPQAIDAWATGAYWYYKTGDPEQARRFISEGISANPQSYQLYLERGILMHRLKKWKDAVSDLECALRMCKGESEDDRLNKKAIEIYLKDAEKQLTAVKS